MRRPGIRLLPVLLLALPLAASADRFDIGADYAVAGDDSTSPPHDTVAAQLHGRWLFHDHWFAGLEGRSRKDRFTSVNAFPQETRQESAGLEIGYSLNFTQRQRVGVSTAGGASSLKSHPQGNPYCPYKGRYLSATVFYDVLLMDHVSIGFSGRHQADRLGRELACIYGNPNATGLSNIVYNPYVTSTYKLHSNDLFFTLGYRF